jgi:5-hydroxyisourate hydrolase
MGRLSTHVLDTARGRPAGGMSIDLHRVRSDGSLALIKSVETNADGRTTEPLLVGDAFATGTYVLSFYVAPYFANPVASSEAPFLDVVPLRFTISQTDGHYHVPLLVTPWSYSTYRGS